MQNRTPYNKLTDAQKEFVAITYANETLNHEAKISIISKKFNVTGRTIRRWWQNMGLTKPLSKLTPQLQKASNKEINKKTDILLVTSAINTTSINYNQLLFMKKLVKKIKKDHNKNAEIVIIPTRYRNPTSPTEYISDHKKQREWWVEEIEEYLLYNKSVFGDVIIGGDIPVQATAQNPLNGMNGFAGDKSLILGSPRIHYRTLPRMLKDPLRVICSSGTISVKNYSRSVAGGKADFNHSNGFVIIEKKKNNKCLPPRNVFVEENGNFSDIAYSCVNGKIEKTKKALNLTLGDTHRWVLDMKLHLETKKLFRGYSFNDIIVHDLLDGYTFNPHERKDPFISRYKILNGHYKIKEEVEQALEYPSDLLNDFNVKNINVIESNHDIFLDRHINDMNWKNDLHNSDAYLEYALIQQTVNLKKYGNIFGYLMHKKYENKDNVKYIKCGDSLVFKGVKFDQHGENGVNGSRGSVQGFKKLNIKTTTAHTHTPSINDGNFCVGKSSVREEYYIRKGLTTQAQGHALQFESGKRQLIVFNNEYEVTNLI